MNHGLRYVRALLVVAYEPTPANHPPKGALNHSAARQDGKARVLLVTACHLNHEVEGCGLVHQRCTVVCAIGKQVFQARPTFLHRLQYRQRPVLSAMSAGVRFTMSSRPSVSTAICRLRPTIFLAAS